MTRQFAFIALSLAIAVTACDKGGKKRVTLTTAQKKIDEKASPGVRELNRKIADRSCLRVDRLVAELMKLKDQSVLVYTADVNMGLLSASGSAMTFDPQLDEKARAVAVMNPKHQNPALREVGAQQIFESEVRDLLPASLDDKCTLAAFNTSSRDPYDVVKKNASDLWLRNKRDGSTYIRYQYNLLGKLTITHFAPNDSAYCDKTPRMRMTKYVIAWDSAKNAVELERGYAELIAANSQAPAELTQAIAKPGALVSVSGITMDTIRKTVTADSFKLPTCQ